MSQPAAPLEIPLWPPGSLPGLPEEETYEVRSDDPAKPNGAIQFVSTPTLRVFLPPQATRLVPAVVICPGGAYVRLAIDKEGIETARWLNRLGVAAFVLKYRLPRPELSGGQSLPWPIQDGLRAMRIVRNRAGEWNIDPSRVGLMGFSAGGHLASFVATESEQPTPASHDPVERMPARPDFLMLVYPVTSLRDVHGTRQALLGAAEHSRLREEYSTQNRVSASCPPCFIIHTRDDGSVPYQDTLAFQSALEAVGVPCEMRLFDEGGHAFALECPGEAGTWPDLAAQWLGARGILP